LNNCAWKDHRLTLTLNSAWGLPDGRSWDLYRWYPHPARLKGSAESLGDKVSIALRAFEVNLLEAVPAGQPPSLGRTLPVEPIPEGFSEESRAVDLAIQDLKPPAQPESGSMWTVLEPVQWRSAGGATLTRQPDGSILAGGENPPTDTYTITADTVLERITGIRLEALPDPSLPANGPGRAANGNFALCELEVTCAPQAGGAPATRVGLGHAMADFSQEGYGGWPVAAAIDGDASTGWSVDPAEGVRHVALFETKAPMSFAGGTRLVFTLRHGDRQHTLGRLRLSVTTAPPPFPEPTESWPWKLLVQGQAPASAQGGILVVATQLGRGRELVHLRNVGAQFIANGTLAGQAASWRPVLGNETYPSPWQAWRIPVGPSTSPQPFALSITTRAPINLESGFSAHFLAR